MATLPWAGAALAALLAAPAAAQETCPDGAPRAATLGIGFFHCVGGGCQVNVKTAGGGVAHDFSTEPRVWNLDPDGPAAGRLREGDVITSVDRALVTTPEGGRRLAGLRAGRPVTLGVRRGAEETEVRLTPVAGCGAPGLVVNASPEKPAWPRERWVPGGGERPEGDEMPPVRFGLQLECGKCGWHRGEEGWHFHSTTALRVKAVDPGGPAERAGVQPGDVLLRVAGRPFTAVGGLVRLASLKPGDTVRMEVLRDGRPVTLTVVPLVTEASAPESPQRIPLVRGGGSGSGKPEGAGSAGGGGPSAPEPEYGGGGGGDEFLPLRMLVAFD